MEFYRTADLPKARRDSVVRDSRFRKRLVFALMAILAAGLLVLPVPGREWLGSVGVPPQALYLAAALAAFLALLSLRRDELPRGRSEIVFREARLGKGLAFALVAAAAIGLPVAPALFPEVLESQDAPPYLAYYAAAVAGVFALLLWKVFRSSLKPSNWLVLAGPEGLYLKYRSYLNYKFPAQDPTVVFIPGNQIAWLRKSRRVTLRPDDEGGDTRVVRRYLEIGLKGDVSRLEAHLGRERARNAAGLMGTKLKALHYPVRVRPGGIVQIDWAGPDTSIRPRIDKAITWLGRWYPVVPPRESEEVPAESLSRDQQEERLLAFVERGEIIAAVTLASRLYGYGTTEARRFVESLRRDQPAR